MMNTHRVGAMVLVSLCALPGARESLAQGRETSPSTPDRQRDRGEGVSTSMFGTYVRAGELLLYPFFEHYRDNNFEYKPSDLGAAGEEDYRGRSRVNEALLWLSRGITDNLAVEFEAAVISASLEKATNDPSGLPGRLTESGLGDVEGQVRWRWRRETDRHPEFFSYAEAVVPHHADKPLTGTAGWELKFGTGLTRGFTWGTLTARGSLEYSQASSSHFDAGEYAVEYLRRLSPSWRVYAGVEGKQDELSLVTEAQWHVTPHAFIRFNSGLGLTPKATDWAPEVGAVFSLGPR